MASNASRLPSLIVKSTARYTVCLAMSKTLLKNLKPDSSRLDAPVIRPPVLDGLLDIRRGELFRERPFGESRNLCIGGKAQSDQLAFGQFRNARAQRLGRKCAQTKTFFQANHAVLHLEGVSAGLEERNCRRHR